MADLTGYGIHVVSRLRNTLGLAATVRAAARQREDWDRVGRLARDPDAAQYQIMEMPGQIGETAVRVVVVESTALVARGRPPGRPTGGGGGGPTG